MFSKFHIELPFFDHSFDIGFLYVVSFGNSFMTGTKCAEAFTKRQMNINADSFFLIALLKASFKRSDPCLRRKTALFPIWHRGIAGVPRAGYIVFVY